MVLVSVFVVTAFPVKNLVADDVQKSQCTRVSKIEKKYLALAEGMACAMCSFYRPAL